ncbi:class I SAM-dependent methyltransferase [Fontimonas sp. SYSU GA230001]|uniref:class I SAM-dependent methyltransferase n=1 Tax=Fontimonas sp. SYSU GA230001 TaxID=3142450 RepID=UPI0032B4C67C
MSDSPEVKLSADPDHALRARAWSRYWSSEVRHSCPGSFEGHYGSATENYWRTRFQRIRPEHVVMEVGCGNGSLIRLLDEAGVSVRPSVFHGIDAARLNLHWLEDLSDDMRARVRVHAQTSVQRLPLSDHSIDHIYSQYALEYCADDVAWSELARVLKPGATFAAIAHCADSYLARVAASERDHCDWLLRTDGVVARAERILSLIAAATGSRPAGAAAEKARSALNMALAELSERVQTGECTDVLDDTAQRIMHLVQTALVGAAGTARAHLQRLQDELVDHRLRVGELVAYALDTGALVEWETRLRELGFRSIEIGEIHEGSHLVGCTIAAE